MRTFSFSLVNARLAFMLVITLVNEVVIRVTSYGASITIDGDTFQPEPGLEIGDYTESNDGEAPNFTFKVGTRSDGPFTMAGISAGLFEMATAVLYITDARNPSLDDEYVSGVLTGEVSFDLEGNATFECLNKFGQARDVFVHEYTIQDRAYFGDPRWNKIPTFPTVDASSDDLQDVERSTTYAVGDRRRFRYDSNDDPFDYHDVYWAVTAITTGITGASDPVAPSDTPTATVTDGGVTWTVYNALARAFTVTDVIDGSHIEITFTEPRASGDDTWFNPGFIVMRSGTMKNWGSKVNAFDSGTGQIALVKPLGRLVEVGDTGEIAPHYDQSLDMAVDKYGDAMDATADGGALNYRGWPHLTGARFTGATQIPGITVDSPEDADDPGAGGGGGGGGFEAFAVEFEPGSD